MNFLEIKLFDETYRPDVISFDNCQIINSYMENIESGVLPLVRIFYLDDNTLRTIDDELVIAYSALEFNKIPVEELPRNHLDIPAYLRK